jgi:hypothetical protein
MATKKKTEVAEADVQQVEAVEEQPKKTTTKKTTTKKKAEPKVEEAPVVAEEPKVEEPVAEPVKVEEKKEEPKKVEPKKEEKKPEGEFKIVITSGAGVYSFKGPGLSFPKVKLIPNGSKLVVSETKGNWGKIGEDKWIILGGTSVRI